MTFPYKTTLFLFGLILVGAGCTQVVETPQATTTTDEAPAIEAETDVVLDEEEEMDEEETVETEELSADDAQGEVQEAVGPGEFIPYNPALLSRAATGDVVLFFHAAWCSSCKALEADINRNRAQIPSDLTIMQVDFDTELDLRREYGVTYQHTMVQVDAQGNLIKKWAGKNTLTSVVDEL